MLNSSRLAAAAIGILGILILVMGYLHLHGAVNTYLVQDLYANLGIDFLGTAITVLVIDYLNEKRAESELKAQLIRDLGSESNLLALRAVRELEAHQNSQGGWLRDGTLRNVSLVGADLSNALLQKADMCNANLTVSRLKNAFLGEARLKSATLRFASLDRANLEGADLSRADLTGACLIGAKLQGARLTGANLCSANVRGADLTNTILEEANIRDIQYDERTIWPEGYDHFVL